MISEGNCEGHICMTTEPYMRVQETQPYHKVFSTLLYTTTQLRQGIDNRDLRYESV